MSRCVYTMTKYEYVWLDMSAQYLHNVQTYLWDANAVLNGNIAFIRSQWGETWLSVHVIPFVPVLVTQCQWYWKLHHFIPLGKTIEMKCNLVILEHWHLFQCHMMVMASSMAPFHFLCQNDWNEHDFLVMHCYWHWHKQHVMLMALSMAPLHLLGQDDWRGATCLFWSCHTIVTDVGTTSHHQQFKEPLHSLHQDNQNEEAMWLFGHVMPLTPELHDVHGIISGTIAFLRSRWSK